MGKHWGGEVDEIVAAILDPVFPLIPAHQRYGRASQHCAQQKLATGDDEILLIPPTVAAFLRNGDHHPAFYSEGQVRNSGPAATYFRRQQKMISWMGVSGQMDPTNEKSRLSEPGKDKEITGERHGFDNSIYVFSYAGKIDPRQFCVPLWPFRTKKARRRSMKYRSRQILVTF